MDANDPLPSSTQQISVDGVANSGGTMETADSSVSDQLKSIDEQKRIAQLEHEIFTVCKQLDEKSEKFKEIQDQNALLKDRLGVLEQEKLDASFFTETLVKSRDTLIQEKTTLQNDLLGLEKRKDELELQASKLSNDKRRHLGDIDELRQKCDKLSNERVHLQIQIDDFQSEKALIAYDKEQWKHEKEILLMSKQWYMNEIGDREQKINELRIQSIKDKSEMQRELSLFEQQSSELTAKADQLQENLLERERELDTVRDQFKKSLGDQTSRMNELEAELRARERLANVYKANSEAANAEIAELNETEARLQAKLKEAEQIVQSVTAEMEKTTEDHKKAIERKDAEIKRLSDEVAKSTELLNAGFRLNRADEDLIQLSPAAAVASSLLKSGMSLTSIYAEHCRVVAELDKKNDEFKQLERYVTELIEDLDSKAPKFQEQRKAYEQICEQNECLRLQNDLLSKERHKLQTNADALNRELVFTKRELERYQREHHLLTIQVQRLLFIVEKGPDALEYNGGTDAENGSDEYLFNNIRELHTKNIELAEALERLQENQDKIIANYHNTEIESLKQACQQSQDDLRMLRDNYSKQELIIRELSEQREQYRQLYEQQQTATAMTISTATPGTVTAASANSNASSMSSATTAEVAPQQMQNRRESIDSLQGELHMWRSKAERLQETLAYVNDDRQTNEKTLNERIDQQLEQISTMRTTIGRLESDLEFQNKNQQLLAKQIDSYTVDLKRSGDALGDAKRQLETLQFKYDSMTNQLLEKQQELSTMRVQNYSLGEQLALSQSREQQAKKELDILRAARYNNERMALTLQEVEVVLKRVEAEKAHASESQLQSALLERDNLRQLVDNLNDQNVQLVNGLKANLSQACGDRDKALAEVKSLQSNINALDNVYQRLKGDHEKLREEMEQIQSTDTNVEACKKEIQKLRNSVAYQEKQIAEWEQKCEELNQAIERKDKQMEEICRLGADMENSIEYGTIERQRMQAIREQLEKDLASSNKTIESLRNELAGKEMELLEQAKQLSEAVNESEDQRAKYEQHQMVLEKNAHEAQLKMAQCQAQIEKLQRDHEQNEAKFAELSETNLRLTTDLAREISKTEELERKLADSCNEFNVEREKQQQTMQMLEQEKMRLDDQINEFMKRDEEHAQKQGVYLDEIQKLVQQNSFMERLNQTIASPTSSASLNASSFSVTGTPNTSRLSTAVNTSQQQQQQHSDRMTVILGYMRAEKQKETELRMNAELELQRIRTQANIDQHKIVQMEAEVANLRTEAEAGAKVAVEKAQLLTQLNALCEVQTRYQQLKKAHDEMCQRFAALEHRTRELEQVQLTAQADKRNFDAKIDAATKELATRTQENKNLLERYNKAMAIASKYSPELVNTLQGDNEKLRSSLAQREKEVQLLNKEGERLGDQVEKQNTELVALKDKSDRLSTALSAVRVFARKFRDERDRLELEKKELETDLKGKNEELVRLRGQSTSGLEATTAAALPGTSAAVEPRSPAPTAVTGGVAAVPGSIAAGALSAIRAAVGAGDSAGVGADNLRRRLDQTMKEKQELSDKVKKLEQINCVLQRELDEANEKVTRMDMVEKLLKSTQKKLTDFNTEMTRLRNDNELLQKRVIEAEMEAQRLKQIEQQQQAEKRMLAELEAEELQREEELGLHKKKMKLDEDVGNNKNDPAMVAQHQGQPQQYHLDEVVMDEQSIDMEEAQGGGSQQLQGLRTAAEHDEQLQHSDMPNPPMTPPARERMSPAESYGLKLDEDEDIIGGDDDDGAEGEVGDEQEVEEEVYGDDDEEEVEEYDEEEEDEVGDEEAEEEEMLNEQEEEDGDDELSHDMSSGEPPLKQSHVQHSDQSQQDEDSAGPSSSAQQKNDDAGHQQEDDEDDDDDIQLL